MNMKLELQTSSRSRTLAIIVLVVMALFVVRLFYLQIIKHGDYLAMADQEQLKRLVIPAKRGNIYAMDSNKPVRLVMNETVYTAFVDPQHVSKPDKIIETFRRVAGGNTRSNIKELIFTPDSRYQIIATKLSRAQAEMIKKEELSGVGFQEVSQRVYPEGQLAAQTLGFVNNDGHGQYGVEAKLEDRLKGENGILQSVTDVSNVPLTIGDRNINQPARDGEDIVLSIDRNVQSYAERALAAGLDRTGAKNGSVIVMNPNNGQIMAMANLPTYKPSEYNKVEDASVFTNAIVSSPYEAGSVIKSLTVAMGLDKKVITPDSTYVNTNSIKVDDRTITNAFKDRTGTITMQDAVNYSLNTGMVTIAQLLGGDAINRSARDIMYNYYHDRFGLGRLTGVEVAGEAEGTVIPPTEIEGNAVRYSNMSFGQGMDVTMVQVAAALSAAINGGTYYKPTVIAGTMKDDQLIGAGAEEVRTNVVGAEASEQIKTMLEAARTKFYAAQDKPGYSIGGKTGTSQTLENGVYIDNQTIGTYLGYGGDNKPRYVIMVQVSGKNMNLQGNMHAMPIFTDISNWLIDYMKLQPKG